MHAIANCNQLTKKKTKRGAGNGEGRQRQSELGQIGEDRGRLVAQQIGETTDTSIVKHQGSRNGRHSQNLTSQVAVNTGTEDGLQIVDESILRSVLLPVVVGVDRAAEGALGLPAGDDGGALGDVAEGIPTGAGAGHLGDGLAGKELRTDAGGRGGEIRGTGEGLGGKGRSRRGQEARQGEGHVGLHFEWAFFNNLR